jgi:S1-C subfamily serine protease
VTPGSIAQKAGIITGDIIYQFDTRAIRALPDLEAAVADSAAHSVARIRLYRGTESAAVEARF